jgi:F0F1-type ATP synthase epsilon subunit
MGERYEGITPNGAGWLWSEKLGLYLGIRERKLRYFTSRGELVKTPEEVAVEERLAKERERAEKERERAAKERERAEKEHERAAKERERAEKEILMAENARLLAKLRELGINPDED